MEDEECFGLLMAALQTRRHKWTEKKASAPIPTTDEPGKAAAAAAVLQEEDEKPPERTDEDAAPGRTSNGYDDGNQVTAVISTAERLIEEDESHRRARLVYDWHADLEFLRCKHEAQLNSASTYFPQMYVPRDNTDLYSESSYGGSTTSLSSLSSPTRQSSVSGGSFSTRSMSGLFASADDISTEDIDRLLEERRRHQQKVAKKSAQAQKQVAAIMSRADRKKEKLRRVTVEEEEERRDIDHVEEIFAKKINDQWKTSALTERVWLTTSEAHHRSLLEDAEVKAHGKLNIDINEVLAALERTLVVSIGSPSRAAVLQQQQHDELQQRPGSAASAAPNKVLFLSPYPPQKGGGRSRGGTNRVEQREFTSDELIAVAVARLEQAARTDLLREEHLCRSAVEIDRLEASPSIFVPSTAPVSKSTRIRYIAANRRALAKQEEFSRDEFVETEASDRRRLEGRVVDSMCAVGLYQRPM